ncbi:hypothetical protein ELG69_16390 [Rhizobium leguminosarum]|nr:hypothetical protein ELG69_16390 [Rhizobium leguminosarum]
MMPIIVFHWQRSYTQTAQIRASLEGREATMGDIIADFSQQPRYSFSAFAVPPGTRLERNQLRRLIEKAGFRKDSASTTWIAPYKGETSLVTLKAVLEDAAIPAVHYHDVPLTFTVSVDVDGLL